MTEAIVTPQTEALFAEFARSGLRELHIRSAGIELYLSNDPSVVSPVVRQQQAVAIALPAEAAIPAPQVPAAPSPGPAPSPSVSPDAVIVRAPNLGTFYGAPKPGAAAYVSVGSVVTVGAELCLIEVMKLFTAVRAEIDGRIEAILATDGEMVEAGQPLFAITRD